MPRREYTLKLGPLECGPVCSRSIGSSTRRSSQLRERERVERHEVADCTLTLDRPLAFDLAEDLAATGRFVIVDNFEISGGGIIRESVPDSQTSARDKVLRRNLKWAAGGVGEERRAERLSQRAALVLITGDRTTDRKRLGRELEGTLFDEGRSCISWPLATCCTGWTPISSASTGTGLTHVRRFSEVANILLDAGLIVIATAIGITQHEVDLIGTTVGADRVSSAWIGDQVTTDLHADLIVTEAEAAEEGVSRLKDLLQVKGVIYRPW